MDYQVGQQNYDTKDDDLVEECSDYEIEELEEECASDSVGKRKNSFVWSYFRTLPESKSSECNLCKSKFASNQVSNLTRHLHFAHNITKRGEVSWEMAVRSKNI